MAYTPRGYGRRTPVKRPRTNPLTRAVEAAFAVVGHVVNQAFTFPGEDKRRTVTEEYPSAAQVTSWFLVILAIVVVIAIR